MTLPLTLEITKNFPSNIRKDIFNLQSAFSYNSVWQTIEWQIMIKETGYAKKSFFIWIYENDQLLSYAIIEKRGLGLWLYGLFSVWGPVVGDKKHIDTLSRALRELSEKEKTVFVQIEPLQEIELSGFKEWFYKNFIEKHTATINLKQNEETILSRMKPKGRYNIKVAEKAGVEVQKVTNNEENLDIFYTILSETLERDKFAANSREYFRVFLGYLEKYNLWGLFLAKRWEEVIAAGIFMFYGKTALYYYGASSSDNAKRKYMATYLLQWKAIEEAKTRGCEVFDFLWIADPKNADSPLLGVTDFKMKLTNETKEWSKSQIFVSGKICYMFLKTKKFLRKIRASVHR